MDFEQVGPRRVETPDGTTVELLDRHHARLDGPDGTWLVELALGDDEDWLAVTVYCDSLVRSGGPTDVATESRALERFVAGIRALRVRVGVEPGLGDTDEVVQVPAHDDQG